MQVQVSFPRDLHLCESKYFYKPNINDLFNCTCFPELFKPTISFTSNLPKNIFTFRFFPAGYHISVGAGPVWGAYPYLYGAKIGIEKGVSKHYRWDIRGYIDYIEY